jgi:hypothetical protein
MLVKRRVSRLVLSRVSSYDQCIGSIRHHWRNSSENNHRGSSSRVCKRASIFSITSVCVLAPYAHLPIPSSGESSRVLGACDPFHEVSLTNPRRILQVKSSVAHQHPQSIWTESRMPGMAGYVSQIPLFPSSQSF